MHSSTQFKTKLSGIVPRNLLIIQTETSVIGFQFEICYQRVTQEGMYQLSLILKYFM
ncbi:hypothetical protein Bpfe_008122 [Biomphalaria pfeifferi]|uniref:Uncharacterized protein n=1 Tax=Biomphalaria pfeifferi TaxID=112525 RepID=A0AAD8FGE3_BIOPF|nr:hypothetical protein Bpfe_008122 [Biomphalaria pfeifferi]